MILTAMEPRGGSRCAVYVEGELALTLDLETITRAHLKPGQTVDRDMLETLRMEEERRAARERALRLLGMRSYTRQELKAKLSAQFSGEIADEIADRMEEVGLVDDATYALRFARDRVSLKGHGPGRIRQDLLQKGVERSLVEDALAALEEELDTDEKLQEIIRRRYMRYLGDRKGVEKTIAALSRLGYGYGDIRRALDALQAETPDEPMD